MIIVANFEEGGYHHNRYVKYLNRIGQMHDSFRAGFTRASILLCDPPMQVSRIGCLLG